MSRRVLCVEQSLCVSITLCIALLVKVAVGVLLWLHHQAFETLATKAEHLRFLLLLKLTLNKYENRVSKNGTTVAEIRTQGRLVM